MITISVIMPCYNCGEYISDAIDSVIKQTFHDWELIIIDDGSTDDSATIAYKYSQKNKRIKIIRQENAGVISARNNGIRSARGKYIYPLDADDKIAPNCLDLLYKTISETNCAVAACEVEKFGTQSGQFVFHGDPTKSNMYQYNCICNGSLFAKSDWDKYGGYDSQFKCGLEDYDFWLNFIDDNRIITRIPKILYYYRIKPGDLSRNNIAMKSHDDLMRKLRKKHKNIIVYSIYRKIKSIFYKRTKRHVYILSIPIKRI